MYESLAINFRPPLLNSANPWASTKEDLLELYKCPSTGAVTTRTSLLKGFSHDDSIHQYAYFDTNSHHPDKDSKPSASETNTLNTLGYSPTPLKGYLIFIEELNVELGNPTKPFIISVTGSAEEVAQCYVEIATTQRAVSMPLLMEVNLSCPNIPDKPPPAYSREALEQYMLALAKVVHEYEARWKKWYADHATPRMNGRGPTRPGRNTPRLPIGIKVPPYTYADQFKTLVGTLAGYTDQPFSFITATNTLGSSLLLGDDLEPALNSSHANPDLTGIGGMAGPALHPLALGNVRTLTSMLKEHEATKHVQVIGVGGVSDADGYRRMRKVGAAAVEVGSALGHQGVAVFKKIEDGLGNEGW